MSDADTEVFRSSNRAECADRAFMLAAVGISSAIGFDGGDYVLRVAPEDEALAHTHLHSYDAESHAAPPPPSSPPARPIVHPNAWVGCVLYVAVLVGIQLAIANGWWRLDAFGLGELDAGQVQQGQWWRAWTALTLHVDEAHLMANLGAGAWFGYLAAREIGSGTSWFLIVSGAAFANLFEAHFGPATHRAVGASTAVFSALGLLVSHSWRTRLHIRQSWALRWSPLVAGAVLLGWFGSGGEAEGTDIVAHVLGFLFGCLLGAGAALPAVTPMLARVPQWLAGIATLASLAIAWGCALSRG